MQNQCRTNTHKANSMLKYALSIANISGESLSIENARCSIESSHAHVTAPSVLKIFPGSRSVSHAFHSIESSSTKKRISYYLISASLNYRK